jgi:hypothetical protein
MRDYYLLLEHTRAYMILIKKERKVAVICSANIVAVRVMCPTVYARARGPGNGCQPT